MDQSYPAKRHWDGQNLHNDYKDKDTLQLDMKIGHNLK